MDKFEFVRKYLQPLIFMADCSVSSVTYRQKEDRTEVVDVTYIDRSCVTVDVTADSLTALARDVLSKL